MPVGRLGLPQVGGVGPRLQVPRHLKALFFSYFLLGLEGQAVAHRMSGSMRLLTASGES